MTVNTSFKLSTYVCYHILYIKDTHVLGCNMLYSIDVYEK